MHHTFTALLAGSRERELRTLSRRPDRLMERSLRLEPGTRGRSRTGADRAAGEPSARRADPED